jgi:hypothetical protein
MNAILRCGPAGSNLASHQITVVLGGVSHLRHSLVVAGRGIKMYCTLLYCSHKQYEQRMRRCICICNVYQYMYGDGVRKSAASSAHIINCEFSGSYDSNERERGHRSLLSLTSTMIAVSVQVFNFWLVRPGFDSHNMRSKALRHRKGSLSGLCSLPFPMSAM